MVDYKRLAKRVRKHRKQFQHHFEESKSIFREAFPGIAEEVDSGGGPFGDFGDGEPKKHKGKKKRTHGQSDFPFGYG